ncbi:hypothetical protein [Pigmentiphaga soli]
MKIFEALNDAGVGCKICTDPRELKSDPRLVSREIFIVDGAGDGDFDVQALARMLRSIRSSFIVMLVDSRSAAHAREIEDAADLYFPAYTAPSSIASDLVSEISHWRERARAASPGVFAPRYC